MLPSPGSALAAEHFFQSSIMNYLGSKSNDIPIGIFKVEIFADGSCITINGPEDLISGGLIKAMEMSQSALRIIMASANIMARRIYPFSGAQRDLLLDIHLN